MRSTLSIIFFLLPLLLLSQPNWDSLNLENVKKFFPPAAPDTSNGISVRTARMLTFYSSDDQPFFPGEYGHLQQSPIPIIFEKAIAGKIEAIAPNGTPMTIQKLKDLKWHTRTLEWDYSIDPVDDQPTPSQDYEMWVSNRPLKKMPLIVIEDWFIDSIGVSSEVIAFAVLSEVDQRISFWVFQNDQPITPKYFQKPDSLNHPSKSKEPFPATPPKDASWMRRTTRTMWNVLPEVESEQIFQHFQTLQTEGSIKVTDAEGKPIDLWEEYSDTIFITPLEGEESPLITTYYKFYDKIHGFEVVQDWWWDMQTNRLKNEVVALAPYYDIYDLNTGEYIGTNYLYWIITVSEHSNHKRR